MTISDKGNRLGMKKNITIGTACQSYVKGRSDGRKESADRIQELEAELSLTNKSHKDISGVCAALMDRRDELEAANAQMIADIKWAKTYAESEYREGDKGYQFSIFLGEALAKAGVK